MWLTIESRRRRRRQLRRGKNPARMSKNKCREVERVDLHIETEKRWVKLEWKMYYILSVSRFHQFNQLPAQKVNVLCTPLNKWKQWPKLRHAAKRTAREYSKKKKNTTKKKRNEKYGLPHCHTGEGEENSFNEKNPNTCDLPNVLPIESIWSCFWTDFKVTSIEK